jgi:hypothetical protein
MAIAKVQSASGNGATIVLNGVVANNALTFQQSAFDAASGTALATPTDSNGTFHVSNAPAGGSTTSLGFALIGTWDEQAAASGTHTVTPSARGGYNGTLTEWSGVATSGFFDVATSAHSEAGAQTSQATGTTATTAQADEVVLISLCVAASPGANPMGLTDPVSGFTTLKNVDNDQSDIGTMHSFKVISATGTQTATFNWTDNSALEGTVANIATFKAAAASANGVVGPILRGGFTPGGPNIERRLKQLYPDQTTFPIPPTVAPTPGPFKKVIGPAISGPPERMKPQTFADTFPPDVSAQPFPTTGRARVGRGGPQGRYRIPQTFADTVIGAATLNATLGPYIWQGLASSLAVIIAAGVGAWTWKGDASPLSTELVATKGAWTWAGISSPLSAEIVSGTGKYTWAGLSSPLSTEIVAKVGPYTWAGSTSPLSVELLGKIGAYAWAGTKATFGSAIQGTIGAYSWAGVTSPPVTIFPSLIGNYLWAGLTSPPGGATLPIVPTGGHGVVAEEDSPNPQQVTIYGKKYTVKSWQAYYSLLHHLTETKERQDAKAARSVGKSPTTAPVEIPSVLADTTFRDWTDLAQREVKRKEDARFLMAALASLKASEGDIPVEVLMLMASEL